MRSLMVIIIVITVATQCVAVVELIGRKPFDPTQVLTRISYAMNAKSRRKNRMPNVVPCAKLGNR
eukprot:2359775-Karenia_brevis.AAC.1